MDELKNSDKEKKKKRVDEEIREVIEDLRPFLNMDGGDVEFIRYDEEEKTVYVRMMGACAMCMIQDDTLENGLLEAIRDRVPCVENIINSPL